MSLSSSSSSSDSDSGDYFAGLTRVPLRNPVSHYDLNPEPPVSPYFANWNADVIPSYDADFIASNFVRYGLDIGSPIGIYPNSQFQVWRSNELHNPSIGMGGRSPAARMVVENLALVEFRKEEDMIDCAICWEEIEQGEIVNKLPCSHYYHRPCIVPWLERKNTCPLCRYALPTDRVSRD